MMGCLHQWLHAKCVFYGKQAFHGWVPDWEQGRERQQGSDGDAPMHPPAPLAVANGLNEN